MKTAQKQHYNIGVGMEFSSYQKEWLINSLEAEFHVPDDGMVTVNGRKLHEMVMAAGANSERLQSLEQALLSGVKAYLDDVETFAKILPQLAMLLPTGETEAFQKVKRLMDILEERKAGLTEVRDGLIADAQSWAESEDQPPADLGPEGGTVEKPEAA